MSQDQEPKIAEVIAGEKVITCCPFCRIPFEPLELNVKNQCPECNEVFSVRKY